MKNKNKKWIKARHAILQKLAKICLYPFVKIKYGAKITKTKDKRQRVVLSNHQTAFDQFFLGYAFSTPLYYLASEDIFSNGFVSKLLRYAVNPIPIKKQTNDIKAVMTCLKVAKEGGSIAIFPEGNRTFSGTTEYMSIAIVKLVKALKLPVSFVRIEGGYGVQPRWSDKTRKGKINIYTTKTIEPQDYLGLTDQELYDLIKKELYVDERDIVAQYKSKKHAEYLERLVYVCPYCGIASFKSSGNNIKCLSCGKEVEYLPDKRLKGVGHDFPFDFVKEWYNYQKNYINQLNIKDYFQKPLFADQTQLFEVELYKSKKLLKDKMQLVAYGHKLLFDDVTLSFDDVTAISVLGRNKLNIYHNGKVYQIKGEKRFNAVKYVNVYYRYKNFAKGDENEQFLGL